MLRVSDWCIQIVVIVLISGLTYGSVVTAPPKEMHLTYANPHIWHLLNREMLLLEPETFTNLRKQRIIDIVDTTLSNTTKFPLKDLPSDIVIIEMQCLNDYDNPELMQHIEAGYLGRIYQRLEYLSIIDCFLQNLTSTTFRGLAMLSSLTIQNKYIKYLPLDVFSNLPNLRMIKMEFCSLTTLSGDLFCHNPKITFAKYGYNNIRAITIGDGYRNLQILELDENQIRELPKDIFKFKSLLSELYVNRNNISRLDETLFEKCARLKTVQISFNQISSLKRMSFISGRIRYIQMSNNKLSVLPAFTKPNSTDCYNFPTLREVKFYYNSITSINASCFQTLQVLGVSYNKITSMDGFGIMSKLTILRMRHNQISTIPKLEMSKLCTTLIQLDLGANMIQNIAKDTFSNCKHLELLKLDKNSIRTFEPIPYSTFRDLRLSSNPFVCDCQNENFFDWEEFNMNVSVDHITCVTGEAITDVHIGECNTSEGLKEHLQEIGIPIAEIGIPIAEIGIPIAVMLVLSFIISGIIFKFRHEIQVIAFYKWNVRLKCCCTKKPGINTNIKYDAFVCFAKEDIRFVTDSLIPLLEPKYRLCVHYRDFLHGEDIAEAILDVINQSAVIIILLSQDFLKSRWGTFEFRNVHHAAITNEDKGMIIIVLEDSVLNSKLDLTLRSVLYSKSYLKKGDELFAEKLLHAMPFEPVEITMNQNEDEEIYMRIFQDTAIERAGDGYIYDADNGIEDHYDDIGTIYL